MLLFWALSCVNRMFGDTANDCVTYYCWVLSVLDRAAAVSACARALLAVARLRYRFELFALPC
jgi:hypothetical protein